MNSLLLDYRCLCGNLLLKGLLLGSHIEIKCRRCARIVALSDRIFSDHPNQYVLVYSPEGAILDASKSASYILEYPPEVLKTKTVFDLAPHVTREGYHKMWSALQRSQSGVFTLEARQHTALGKMLMLRTKLKIHPIEAVAHVLALYELIEAPINSSESTPFINNDIKVIDLMAEVDTRGQFTFVSLALAETLGYPRSEILGTPLLLLYPEAVRRVIQYEFDLMHKSQQAFSVERSQLVMANGNELILDLCFVPAHHPNNRLKGFKILGRR